jgi:hypothetical protein
MLPRIDAAKLTSVREPFDHPDFLFELKHDGFRALEHVWNGKCELVSPKRNPYKSFQEFEGQPGQAEGEGRNHRRRDCLPGLRRPQRFQRTSFPPWLSQFSMRHSSTKVTTKSYSHWVKGRQDKLEDAVKNSWAQLGTVEGAA